MLDPWSSTAGVTHPLPQPEPAPPDIPYVCHDLKNPGNALLLTIQYLGDLGHEKAKPKLSSLQMILFGILIVCL